MIDDLLPLFARSKEIIIFIFPDDTFMIVNDDKAKEINAYLFPNEKKENIRKLIFVAISDYLTPLEERQIKEIYSKKSINIEGSLNKLNLDITYNGYKHIIDIDLEVISRTKFNNLLAFDLLFKDLLGYFVKKELY